MTQISTFLLIFPTSDDFLGTQRDCRCVYRNAAFPVTESRCGTDLEKQPSSPLPA